MDERSEARLDAKHEERDSELRLKKSGLKRVKSQDLVVKPRFWTWAGDGVAREIGLDLGVDVNGITRSMKRACKYRLHRPSTLCNLHDPTHPNTSQTFDNTFLDLNHLQNPYGLSNTGLRIVQL